MRSPQDSLSGFRSFLQGVSINNSITEVEYINTRIIWIFDRINFISFYKQQVSSIYIEYHIKLERPSTSQHKMFIPPGNFIVDWIVVDVPMD